MEDSHWKFIRVYFLCVLKSPIKDFSCIKLIIILLMYDILCIYDYYVYNDIIIIYTMILLIFI